MKYYDPLEWDDIKTYCDIFDCSDCPRCGDDCDGEFYEEDDIDVDLVFRLNDKNSMWTPKTLKDKVGTRLKNSQRYKDMLDEEGRRCWTCTFSPGGPIRSGST